MSVVPTTILPPRVTRTLVHRPALEALTDKIAQSRLTAVSAPAGSGKTTAMLFWADLLKEQGRPVLWLAARAGLTGEAFSVAVRLRRRISGTSG